MYNLRALIKYEYKKLLQRKAVWIVTLTLMAMAAASVILPPFMTVISSNNDNGDFYYLYDQYKAQRELTVDLAGRALDDKLLSEMNEAYRKENESTERITAAPDSEVPYSCKYDDINSIIYSLGLYEADNAYTSTYDNGIPYYTGTAAQLYDLRKDYLQARWAQESLSEVV